MATGEGRPGILRCCRHPQILDSLRVQKDLSSLPDNPADLSDVCSDSGSDYDASTRHVVQWLESLPAEHQWCEAEEQIGRPDSSEAFVDGISSIGDSDAPITLKSQATESRSESPDVKKTPKSKKYRRGAMHANSASKNETAKPRKKSTSGRAKSGASKKTKKSSCPSEISAVTEDSPRPKADALTSATTAECRPVFCNPEYGKRLDEAMTRAINRYKRSERAWEAPSGKIAIERLEPPAKRSRAASLQF